MITEIDKNELYQRVLNTLKDLVDNARAAVMRAYETATHEENIAENKYDTLGLEAAYLAEGQARRLTECESDLQAFKNIAPRRFDPDAPISVGALVQLEDESGASLYLLLGPAAGGVKVSINNVEVKIVTASSPLGKALLHAKAGDDITISLAAKRHTYEVIAVQ